MSGRQHIKKNGEYGPCEAEEGNCPIGGEGFTPFHGTEEEVKAESARRLERKHGAYATLRRAIRRRPI